MRTSLIAAVSCAALLTVAAAPAVALSPAPSAEQQAQMAAAISSSGLALDRFNAISGAVSQDAHLRARMAVADARRAG